MDSVRVMEEHNATNAVAVSDKNQQPNKETIHASTPDTNETKTNTDPTTTNRLTSVKSILQNHRWNDNPNVFIADTAAIIRKRFSRVPRGGWEIVRQFVNGRKDTTYSTNQIQKLAERKENNESNKKMNSVQNKNTIK